jgi:hypothetical protein
MGQDGLVLDVSTDRYNRALSDIKAIDIAAHEGEPRRAITEIVSWLNRYTHSPVTWRDQTLQADVQKDFAGVRENCRLHKLKTHEVKWPLLVGTIQEFFQQQAKHRTGRMFDPQGDWLPMPALWPVRRYD